MLSHDIRKVKNAMDIVNFMNNLESVFDHLVKRNDCYKLDRKTEYMVEAGASTKVDVLSEEQLVHLLSAIEMS